MTAAYGREALPVPAVVQAGNAKGDCYCPIRQQRGFSSALIDGETSSVQHWSWCFLESTKERFREVLFAPMTWRGLCARSWPLRSFDCFSQQTFILVGIANLLLRGDGVLPVKLRLHGLSLQKPAQAALEQTEGTATSQQGRGDRRGGLSLQEGLIFSPVGCHGC